MIVVPARMGQINKRTLLGRLQKMGQGSRAELARLLGISQPTAGRIVDELLAVKVLEELPDGAAGADTGKTNGRLGRPSRMLRLDSTHPRFVAIHLGVSETRLALVPLGVGNAEHWDLSFPTPPSAEEWSRLLRNASQSLNAKGLWGVLVSAPGIVDENGCRILFSPNLHWTEKADLPALLRDIWNVPVLLVQEERALSLGHHAAVPEDDSFLLVDFGEGVGGAVVVGGQSYTGPLPVSGELGHTPVLGNWRPCGCGAVGCVETLISTRGLLQSFALAVPGAAHTWPSLIQYISQEGVTSWLGEAIDAAAAVIAGAANVLGVGHIVITGSLTELSPGVVTHLERAVVKGTMWARFGKVTCVSAPRRRTLGLVCVGLDRLVASLSDQFPSKSSRLFLEFQQHNPSALP
ncbi:MAG TPA: ROK family protein [Verrucomicrobiae bacterium]|nr:ROK family protein [Verrucomicrobiae bacterium]